jgi:hypothetical protein
MSEVNEGVGIILARMDTNPEEFFGMGDQSTLVHKWRWIFAESFREVMTEPEKAAIFEGMKRIRRLEITHKAIAAVMPQEEEAEDKDYGLGVYNRAIPKAEGGTVKYKAQGRYNP